MKLVFFLLFALNVVALVINVLFAVEPDIGLAVLNSTAAILLADEVRQ